MPKGRFWMGKCESGETSMNDLSDMMVGTPRRGVRTAQRAVRTLQQIQRAQIVAWLIEAATAKRNHESPAILQPSGIDPPFAPRKKIVSERKRIRVFVFEHHRGLMRIPSMLRSERRRAQHIQTPMHLCLDFFSVLSQRMVKTGRKFDRQLMRSRGHDCFGNLHRS